MTDHICCWLAHQIARWRVLVKGLTDSILKQSALIQTQRGSLGQAACDISSLETFRPAKTPSARDRLAATMADKASKMVAQARSDRANSQQSQTAGKKKKKKRKTPQKVEDEPEDDGENEEVQLPKKRRKRAPKAVPDEEGGDIEADDMVMDGFDWDT